MSTRIPPFPAAVPVEQVLRPVRHELSNVLSPIVTIVDLLAVRGGSMELDLLVREVRQLVLMLDDVWALVRTMHGELPLEPRTVELDDVIGRVVEGTWTRLDQVNAALELAVPTGLRVMADPACLLLALCSIVCQSATPSARLVLAATRTSAAVTLRIHAGTALIPAERALVFSRELLALIGGTLVIGDDLRVSLPIGQ